MSSPVIDGGAEKQAAQPGPTKSHARFSAAVGAILKEAGWVLKEIAVCLFRGIVALWSLARQRRLETRRRETLQDIGAQLRQRSIPESLRALSTACDRCDDEIKSIDDASGLPAAGRFSALKRRARLKRAQSARKLALEKLGEAGASSLESSDRDPLRSIDVAISAEKARRTELWQPWRTLPFLRRAEVASLAVLFAGAAFLLLWHSTNVTSHEPPAKMLVGGNAGAPRHPPLPQARSQGQANVTSQRTESDKDRIQSARLDFERERQSAAPGRWLYAATPVLQRGELNQWDDFKVGEPAVLKDRDRFRLWYRGCHFIGLEYSCGIGHAVSSDGITWEKTAQPVIVPGDPNVSRKLRALTVVRAGDYFWMWYSMDPDRFAGRLYATIHLATSKDGLHWGASRPVVRALSSWTPAVEPAAFFDGKLFHLWYADYPSDDDKTLIHATSANGVQWQTVGSMSLGTLNARPGRLSVLPDGRGGYRAIFSYSAREQPKAGLFGTLVSSDGNQWRRGDAEIKLSSSDVVKRDEVVTGPAALPGVDGLWVWFTLRPQNGAERIRLAFLKEATR